MIVYYTAAPGRGHITRAAALARRITDEEVFVLHFSEWTEALDWAGIPHMKARNLPVDIAKQPHKLLVDGRDFYRLAQDGRANGLDMEANPVILPLDSEILSREEARAVLNLDKNDKVLFALKNLYGDTIAPYLSRADGWKVVEDVPYPAAIYMRAADAVIGNAGYNLYWETKLIGVPAFLIPDKQASDQPLRATQKFPSQFSEFLATIYGS